MANNIEILIIKFQNEISNNEIPLFRGAVLDAIKDDDDILFHNHINDGFRYSYPLIQYKRIKGKAAIVCINEGANAIRQFLSKLSYDFSLGEKRRETFVIDVLEHKPDDLIIDGNKHYYNLNRWIPFNEENYNEYNKLETIIEKTEFLQRIITGNILSLASGLGVRMEERLSCDLISIGRIYNSYSKGVMMRTYDITFRANVNLPNYIGIGKHSSIGFGIISKLSKR